MLSISTIAFRHPKKDGMFLFIKDSLDWSSLPEPLQQEFALRSEVTRFEMTPNKKLARSPSATVWESLSTHGFYLQMPPSDPFQLQQIEDQWIAQQETSQIAQS